jgi:acetyl-CoA C-acetyltransferase
MRRSGAPDDIGILVALKDRVNALKNPYAHLHEPEISYDSIKESFMLWEPIRYSETCPSSDGAFAMVLGSEKAAEQAQAATGVRPAWIIGTSMKSEPATANGRDQITPQAGKDCAADVYRQAGITNPLEQIDMVEMYVPFSWYEPMWLENLGFAAEGEGWKLTENGTTQMDGQLPVNCSGGVLSTNPIGASGMIRFGEAAMQVRGQAGDHQVDGAKTALGHAYGGAAQFFAMWVVRAEKP